MTLEDCTCDDCGYRLESDEEFLTERDGMWLCSFCLEDLERDHPNWENLVAEAEYRHDSLTDR